MENKREIEVEYESNEKDFQRMLFWYHWKRLVFEFGSMMVVVIFLCYLLDFDVLDFKNNGVIIITFFLTMSILFALNIYSRCFIQAKKLKEIAAPSKTTFSELGIESKTPTSSSNRNWENYSKIYETDKDFIFFAQENVFAGIPKRFFRGQKEIQALRELINRKIGEKAKLQN